MTKKEILDDFNYFRSNLSYPYGRAYFSDEILSIIYHRDFTMQLINIKRNEINLYSEFSNYNFILDKNKIEQEDYIKILVIRHFDIYIEFVMSDENKNLKGNVKNKSFNIDETNKLSHFNSYLFLKGQLFNPLSIFKQNDYNEIVINRKLIVGSWICNDFKIYFKENNQLVYIKGESVLFGNYYFIDNFLKFYFENAKEYKFPEELYYEFHISENGYLTLTNESYDHYYDLEKILM